MRVAICALAWNQANVTERWLRSVESHSGGDTRLFLLDNGSTDNGESLRVLLDATVDDEVSVALRNEENESIYRGWNRLAALALEAGSEVIILSNNDLLVGPGWLTAARREVAAGGKRYFLPNGNFTRPDFFEDDARAFLASFDASGPRTLPNARAGWCLILPAAAVREFLPIPEQLVLWYGDDYIHWKLARAGYSCETILDCTALHYGSVSFYARPGYNAIVEQDKATWQAWLAAQEGRP